MTLFLHITGLTYITVSPSVISPYLYITTSLYTTVPHFTLQKPLFTPQNPPLQYSPNLHYIAPLYITPLLHQSNPFTIQCLLYITTPLLHPSPHLYITFPLYITVPPLLKCPLPPFTSQHPYFTSEASTSAPPSLHPSPLHNPPSWHPSSLCSTPSLHLSPL